MPSDRRLGWGGGYGCAAQQAISAGICVELDRSTPLSSADGF
jgi:hypothetical protein